MTEECSGGQLLYYGFACEGVVKKGVQRLCICFTEQFITKKTTPADSYLTEEGLLVNDETTSFFLSLYSNSKASGDHRWTEEESCYVTVAMACVQHELNFKPGKSSRPSKPSKIVSFCDEPWPWNFPNNKLLLYLAPGQHCFFPPKVVKQQST